MKITSSAFDHQGSIPPKYTCDGSNISPPLQFHDVPSGTKSLALIVDDPDVPERLRADRNWDHWIVWNIPPATAAIGEAAGERGGATPLILGRTGCVYRGGATPLILCAVCELGGATPLILCAGPPPWRS